MDGIIDSLGIASGIILGNLIIGWITEFRKKKVVDICCLQNIYVKDKFRNEPK